MAAPRSTTFGGQTQYADILWNIRLISDFSSQGLPDRATNDCSQPAQFHPRRLFLRQEHCPLAGPGVRHQPEMASHRYSLRPGQWLESPRDPGAADAGQPPAVQVPYVEWQDRQSELLLQSDQEELVWSHHQLSAGRKLRAATVLDLVG